MSVTREADRLRVSNQIANKMMRGDMHNRVRRLVFRRTNPTKTISYFFYPKTRYR
jgi:hypothetical protein